MTQNITVEHPTLGTRTVTEEDLWTFPDGVLGFEKERRFAKIVEDDFAPFAWLINVDNPRASFLTVNPFLIDPDYAFDLDDDSINVIEAKGPQDVELACVVTIRTETEKSTCNMKAPIVMNVVKKLARQVVLHKEKYSVRESLFNRQPEQMEATDAQAQP